MNDVRVIGQVDIERIKEELSSLKMKAQFPLQGKLNGELGDSVGIDYDLRDDEHEFTHYLHDLPYTNLTLQRFGMYRSRVMKMIKGTAYGIHVDNTPRIHIPLETNEKCLFIINDVIYRMPADGSVYFTDTTKPHTAVNASTERFIRTHIIGNVNV